MNYYNTSIRNFVHRTLIGTGFLLSSCNTIGNPLGMNNGGDFAATSSSLAVNTSNDAEKKQDAEQIAQAKHLQEIYSQKLYRKVITLP